MKTKHLLSSIFVLILIPFLASAAVFIKFDGVDGESKDKDHKGWIDLSSVSQRSGGHDDWIVIESFSQIVHRDPGTRNVKGRRDVTSGLPTGKRDATSGLPTGKRQYEPIRVIKRIDKATPMLAQALSSGNSIGNVTMQRSQGGKPETITLVNATVASIQKKGSLEHITFNYQQVHQTSKAIVRGWDPKSKQAIQGKAKEKANRTK